MRDKKVYEKEAREEEIRQKKCQKKRYVRKVRHYITESRSRFIEKRISIIVKSQEK
jgi:hypothetical protein